MLRTLLPISLACSFALSAHAELTATFKADGKSDSRRDRLPALFVPAGQAPTPFLKPGPFEVTWSGTLVLKERQRLYFSFAGRGTASLKIDDEPILSASGNLGETRSERIRLNPGEHPVTIHYQSPAEGDAQFRLFWEERSFPRQSIPPTAFKPLDSSPDASARIGRKIFADAHCAKCHQPNSGFGPNPMPELQEIAPILSNSGNRLNPKWIAEWIANPHQIKPDTTMPALIDPDTDEGKQQAADLAAWLTTLKIAEPEDAPDSALATRGGAHFHQLGCIACHSRPDAKPAPDLIPLNRVAAKYQPGALVEFLQNPSQWAPHTKMPDFDLSTDQAKAIAAWLLKASANGPKPAAHPQGDPARGQSLAKALNCGACHAGSPLDLTNIPSLESIFRADWSQSGCLTNNPDLPNFPFTPEQTNHLINFSKPKSSPTSLTQHVPAEYAHRQMQSLRCNACHDIDHHSSTLSQTHFKTKDLIAHVNTPNDQLDQSRPHLTLAGEMLKTNYLRQMIAGKERARPWLEMRMPGYPSRAEALATGITHLHGIAPNSRSGPDPNPDLATTGKQLIGTDGFACTTCHAVGDKKPDADFEVAGINLALSKKRLRHEWFMRWMDNPASVTPHTKMPRYSQRGRSQLTHILDGDAAAQFNAIWNYILEIPPSDPSDANLNH